MLAACGGGGGGGGDIASSNNSAALASAGKQPQESATSARGAGTAQSSESSGSSGSEMQADATQARFNQPMGLALDVAGNLYVADTQNFSIRKITPSGVVSTLAGTPGLSGSADGTGAAARFSFLKDIAVDSAGNVYAVDNGAIRKITAGGVVTTLAGVSGVTGDADGAGAAARFNHPWGIATDPLGTLYVADTDNYLIRKVTPDGIVSTYAGTRGNRGVADGSMASATLLGPRGIARDPSGNLVFTDWYGPPAPNIPEGSTFIRKVATDGSVSTLAGNYRGEQGPAAFSDTFAIAADGAGNAYVAAFGSIHKVSSAGAVSVVASPVGSAQSLEGLASDGNGVLFAADTPGHAILRVTQDGTATVYAGEPGEAGSADAPK